MTVLINRGDNTVRASLATLGSRAMRALEIVRTDSGNSALRVADKHDPTRAVDLPPRSITTVIERPVSRAAGATP